MAENNSTYQILLTASDATKEAFNSVKLNTESLTDKLGIAALAFTATAVASATAVAVMVKGAIDSADAMNKASQKVGTTTEMLSGLKYAAELSDVSFEALQKSLGKLSQNAFKAATAGDEAATAFSTLGIKVKGTDGHLKDTGALLEEVAGKFAKMPDSTEKTALAMQLFGKAGMDMIPLLNAGSDGIEALRKEAEKLGIVISQDTAARAEEFNDNLLRIKKTTEGLVAHIAADLLPALGEVAKAYADASKDGSSLMGVSSGIKTIFETLVIVGANVGFVFKETGREIGAFIAMQERMLHFDFKGMDTIWSISKKDSEEARAALDAFEQRILHPPKPEGVKERGGERPDIDTEKINKELDALLKNSERMVNELVVSHDSAFTKIVNRYVEMETSLSAAGEAGSEQRKVLQKAFTTFLEEETIKRTDEINAAFEKETDANNKLIAGQQEKFMKMQAQADEASKTGDERENARYAEKLRELDRDRDVLEEKHLWDLKSEAKYQLAMSALKKDHQKKQMQSDVEMVNFGRAIKAGEYTDAMSMAAKMTAGIAGHSRAAFEINKVASIAVAIMNTYKGISGVLAEFPGPAGWALAAAQAAIGFVQVDMIQSTEFGGGGARSGGGGVPSLSTAPGIPVAPQQDVPQAPTPSQGIAAFATRTINISMKGEAQLYTAQSIRDQLIPALNEAAGDGVVINVVNA